MYKYYKERIRTVWAPGIKTWSNGIPLKADVYQSCSGNYCRFCYASALRESTLGKLGIKPNPRVARLLNLKSIVKFFEKMSRGEDNVSPFMNWALRNKYYIELGTTGETFQKEDLNFRVAYNFFKLTSDFQIPIFINTKLDLVCYNDEYKRLLIEHKAPIIICLSLSSTEDELAKVYEPLSPLPSLRLKTIKELVQYPHIVTVAYISPFMPSVTNINVEKFTYDLLNNGIIGAHLRDFFLQGKMFKTPFWEKYIKANSNYLESFPGGMHVGYELRKEFLLQMTEIASKVNPHFQVVGMKSKWFELNPFHGKMNFDMLPESFRNGVTDYTAIPIMRKIRERKDIPQLLIWSKIGYKEGKINLPSKIKTNEGAINNLTEGVCNCNTSDINYEMSGYDWLVSGLWNGFDDSHPCGFFSELDYIYPVKSGKDYLKENGNFIYAYLPKEYNRLLKQKQLTLLDEGKTEGYLEFSDVKDFYVPERIGGIEDKWIS